MSRRLSGFLTFAAFTALALNGSAALAQGAPPAAAAPKDPAKADDPIERARLHYERGLQLFNEENYDAALFEFDRAYELAPSYKILYNMGRIQRQQHNYAAALRSYARYLREGGTGVPPERQAEVEKEISILKPRVAAITVKVNIDGADVYSDDIPVCTATIESSCVGKSPLRTPIMVNGGRHKITATKAGYAPATSLVSVVGSDAIEVKLDLVSYSQPTAAPTNPWKLPMFIGWGVTGAGLITAGITGYLATSAKDDQQAAVDRFGTTRSELDDAKDKTRTLGNVTDAFLIGSAVAAGVSTYLTIRAVRWKGEAASVDVQTGLGNVTVLGKF